MKTASMLVARATAAGLLLLTLAGFDTGPTGQVLDEARTAGRDAASFPAATEDFFHDMDGGIALTPEEVKGRNMWIRVERRRRPLLGHDDAPARSARSIC